MTNPQPQPQQEYQPMDSEEIESFRKRLQGYIGVIYPNSTDVKALRLIATINSLKAEIHKLTHCFREVPLEIHPMTDEELEDFESRLPALESKGREDLLDRCRWFLVTVKSLKEENKQLTDKLASKKETIWEIEARIAVLKNELVAAKEYPKINKQGMCGSWLIEEIAGGAAVRVWPRHNPTEDLVNKIAELEQANAELARERDEMGRYIQWATLEAQILPRELIECHERLKRISHSGYRLYSKYDLDGTQARNNALSASQPEGEGDYRGEGIGICCFYCGQWIPRPTGKPTGTAICIGCLDGKAWNLKDALLKSRDKTVVNKETDPASFETEFETLSIKHQPSVDGQYTEKKEEPELLHPVEEDPLDVEAWALLEDLDCPFEFSDDKHNTWRLRALSEKAHALLQRRAEPSAFSDYGEGRCEVCGWTLADSRENGCVPGSCFFCPDDGSPEYYRIRARKLELKRREEAKG